MLDGYVTVTAVEWILRLRNAEEKAILGISTIILIKASPEGYITTPFILPLPLRLYSLREALLQQWLHSFGNGIQDIAT